MTGVMPFKNPNVWAIELKSPKTVSYDSSLRVSSIADPASRITTLSYDPTSGNIVSIQDWAGPPHQPDCQRRGQFDPGHHARAVRLQPGL